MTKPPPLRLCDDCKELAPRSARTPTGGLCRRCYNIRRREPCSKCGKVQAPAARDQEGNPLCTHCSRPKRACAECGRVDHAKAVTEAGPLCQRCYRPPRRLCGVCGENATVAARTQDGIGNICKRCYRSPAVTCALCLQLEEPRTVVWPVGPVCGSCYRATLRNPGPCPLCRKTKALIGMDPQSQRVCGPCAASTIDYCCQTCGSADSQYFEQTCERCSVAVLVRDLLEQGSKPLPIQLAQLPDFLANRGEPASTLRWLQRTLPQRLIRELGARGNAPLEHRDIDRFPPGQARHFLRNILVAAEILPPRNEQLERLDTWLEEFLAGLPAAQAAVIAPYGRWRVLRTMRRRSNGQRVTAGSADGARGKVLAAAKLLAYAEQNGAAPSHVTQDLLDSWIGSSRSRAQRVAPFVTWLNFVSKGAGLVLGSTQSALPSEMNSEEEHFARVTQLIAETANDAKSLGIQVSGLLVLLYGARIERLHRLTSADVTISGAETFVRLAQEEVRLPEAIGLLVRRLVEQTRNIPRAKTHDGNSHYLIPSPRRGHEPIHPGVLSRWLTRKGIHARLSRNYAMLALAADLPAAVLSAQMGMTPKVATQWSRLAQRDTAAYLDARMHP